MNGPRTVSALALVTVFALVIAGGSTLYDAVVLGRPSVPGAQAILAGLAVAVAFALGGTVAGVRFARNGRTPYW